MFNGFNIGSVLGLSLAPLIIEQTGWRTVFYIFGGIGVAWVTWVGLGIYRRGGAMPGWGESDVEGEVWDVDAPTAPVRGLMGKRIIGEEKPALLTAAAAAAAPAAVAEWELSGEALPVPSRNGASAVNVIAVGAGAGNTVEAGSESVKNAAEEAKDPPIPWRQFLSSTPLRALCYVHFCNNWGRA